MTKLLDEIKSKTRNMSCPEHKKQAEIKIIGDQISFTCCCEKFRSKMHEISTKVTQEFTTNEMKKIFKKFK